MKNELVDIIYQSLKFTCDHVCGNTDKIDPLVGDRYGDIRIADVSLDGDHKSSEVIITLDDGEQKKDKKQAWFPLREKDRKYYFSSQTFIG